MSDEKQTVDPHKPFRVAYYQELVRAWIDNRMYIDRQIVYLSTAGIGYLIHLLGEIVSWPILVTWWASMLFFLATIPIVFFVHNTNCRLIESVTKKNISSNSQTGGLDKQISEINSKVAWLSAFSLGLFLIGVLLLILLVLQSIPLGKILAGS